MLAPFPPVAMLRVACGRSAASPTESGSMAPALQGKTVVHSNVQISRRIQSSEDVLRQAQYERVLLSTFTYTVRPESAEG
jgi:hypothetical protein